MPGQQQWPGDVPQQDINPAWAAKPTLQGDLYVPGNFLCYVLYHENFCTII